MRHESEVKDRETMQLLNSHPMLEKLRQENKAKTLKKRQGAVEAIKRIEVEAREILPPMQKRLEDLQGQVVEAEAMIQGLREDATRAWQAEYSMKLRLDSERNVNMMVLLDCYDPEIDHALGFFRGELDRLRHPKSLVSHRSAGALDMVRMKKKTSLESNMSAINKAIDFCQGAVKEIEEMRFLPEYPEARVEELKRKIPSIERFELIRVEPSNEPLSPNLMMPPRSRTDRLLGR